MWLEYAAQVQGEHSIFWSAYDETIDGFCHDAVKHLSETEVGLLWLGSERYFNWDDDEPAAWEEVIDGVFQELRGRIDSIAAETALPPEWYSSL